MNHYTAAKNKLSKISPGDVIEYKRSEGENNKWVVVQTIPPDTVHLLHAFSYVAKSVDIVEIVKYYEIVFDNKGELTVLDVLNNLHGKRKEENEEEEEIKLTDVLKVGDFIKSVNIQNPAFLKVLYIDNVTEKIHYHNIATNQDDIVPFDFVNQQTTRVKYAPLPKALIIKETYKEEIYVPQYNETWIDKQYIKYCERKSRDIAKWTHKEKIEMNMNYTDILKWLRTNLKPDQITKLHHDLGENK